MKIMRGRRIILTFLLGFSFLPIPYGLAQDFQRSVVTDPSISRRCEALISERQKKILHKQRLDALLLRNQQVQRLTPDERATLRRRLESHNSRVQQEQHLSLVQIQHLEERIVRQGCPGIRL
jgi:hypothetical protein